MFYSIAELLMIDKIKRQRLVRAGTIPPGGFTMMDTCLQLMPSPSLIMISVALPFWPLAGISMAALCKLIGHSFGAD